MKKRILSLVLAFTLILALVPMAFADTTVTATPTASKVFVDGEEVAFDAYLINDENYFKLRDVAHILNGTRVQFDAALVDGAINLYKNKAYTPDGSEMQSKGEGDKDATLNKMKILIDGAEVELTAYLIGGNNYFKMRELMMSFDFHGALVDGVIQIDTNKTYDGADAAPAEPPAPEAPATWTIKWDVQNFMRYGDTEKYPEVAENGKPIILRCTTLHFFDDGHRFVAPEKTPEITMGGVKLKEGVDFTYVTFGTETDPYGTVKIPAVTGDIVIKFHGVFYD
ncbi:MAG: hypothetical protein FWG36_09940 [Oscillospiraceae bacterium]|nr:hypothetical protein [Oscillospiraceae bacterium]